MIHFIFTLDYEMYGNGSGKLRELVYEPTERLASIFKGCGATFVVFAEAAELQKIEEYQADEAIEDVKQQLRRLHEEGFEIGLHLHPWWFNAHLDGASWTLDWSERNLCRLPGERVREMIAQAISYLRRTLTDQAFTPVSFRGGTWIMQPTPTTAEALLQAGVRIDSSVFKGGRSRDLGFDYRPALKNGYYWRFSEDVNLQDDEGRLLEIPILTEMQPFWRMLRCKRIGIHTRNIKAGNAERSCGRWLDLLRFRYPKKLDFCRMSFVEMRDVIERLISDDRATPDSFKPIVAIGHSKDLVDFDTVQACLHHLRERGIEIANLQRSLGNTTKSDSEAARVITGSF